MRERERERKRERHRESEREREEGERERHRERGGGEKALLEMLHTLYNRQATNTQPRISTRRTSRISTNASNIH